MTTKVNFKLLKQTIPYLEQIVNTNLSHLHGSNLKRFFEILSESSSFAHLAHKKLSSKKTAEVRQAIQQLKSSELIHKSSDDMRNEDY